MFDSSVTVCLTVSHIPHSGLQDRLAKQERRPCPHVAQEVVCTDRRYAVLLQDTTGTCMFVLVVGTWLGQQCGGGWLQ